MFLWWCDKSHRITSHSHRNMFHHEPSSTHTTTEHTHLTHIPLLVKQTVSTAHPHPKGLQDGRYVYCAVCHILPQ